MSESLESLVDKICSAGSAVQGGKGPVGSGGLLEFQPGTQYIYGLNFDVLGRIIEIVSKQTLDVYMTENIFKPLNMPDTAFYFDGETDEGKAQLARLVPCFDFVPGFGYKPSCRIRSSRVKSNDGSPQLLMGGGGLVSTIDDFARFCNALVTGTFD
jgi:CubicO group peptidase (beta-lactamase class C family)